MRAVLNRCAVTCLAAGMLTACAAGTEPGFWNPSDNVSLGDALQRGQGAPEEEGAAPAEGQVEAPTNLVTVEDGAERRPVPVLRPGASGVADPTSEGGPPDFVGPPVNVTMAPQPLPSFVETVMGEILEAPYSLGPGVAEREDVVSLRSVRQMDRDSFFNLFRATLEDYGLGVSYEDGLFSVVERSELMRDMPRFVRARARRDVPAGLRPVVQFVELYAIESANMQTILRQAFPGDDTLTATADRATNAIVISGLPEDVDAALEIISQMDELRFAGTEVVTFTPRNWSAEELATEVSNILTLEGYVTSVGVNQPKPIALLPVGFTNQLMVFAADRDLLDHVIAVARRLDLDAERSGETESAFVYSAQYAGAEDLAEIVSSVLSNRQGAAGRPAGSAESSSSSDDDDSGMAGGGAEDESNTVNTGALTVDEAGNRIIFMGTSSEYEKIATLLRQLDTPVPEVLIEVTVAEITLTADTDFGIEFLVDTLGGTGDGYEFGTSGGLGLASGGLTAVIASGDVDIAASAAASNNRIDVLSTPRVVATSGTAATIQVGTEVPVITSQRAANSQAGGTTDILQTVQYRSTGVILNVEPRVYSSNRIDLTISQEVSSAEDNPNQQIAGPLILNRSLTSQLTLEDGQTAVLGGLMENRLTRGNTGVPLLKDVPILGNIFRTQTMSAGKTMLLVLITPYQITTSQDRDRIVRALSEPLNASFNDQLTMSPTLTPPTAPMQIETRPGLAPAPAAAGGATE